MIEVVEIKYYTMKKRKKYKLNELLDGINKENLHDEILTGKDVGEEWPTDEKVYEHRVGSRPKGKEIIPDNEKEDFEKFLDINDETKHLLSNPKNASRIKAALNEYQGLKDVPSKKEYEKANERMEEIIKLNLVTNDTPMDDPLLQELVRVSNIVEAYEEKHFPIGEPTLEHRSYKGSVNGDEGSYWGKVKNTESDRVSYQGSTLEELEENFKKALDLYLDSKLKEKK